MKNPVSVFLFAMGALTFGCDPGMTIRQVKPPNETAKQFSTTGPRVVINIKTEHRLIGETWYAPQLNITNSDDSPIAVTGVELIASGMVFANEPPQSGFYPLLVRPGATEGLLVRFSLSDSVKKVFQHSAELRMHYKRNNKEEIVSATVAGGPLDAATR